MEAGGPGSFTWEGGILLPDAYLRQTVRRLLVAVNALFTIGGVLLAGGFASGVGIKCNMALTANLVNCVWKYFPDRVSLLEVASSEHQTNVNFKIQQERYFQKCYISPLEMCDA